MFDNVTVVGGPLVLSAPTEVDAAEAQISIRFPSGYREYVTRFGEGELGGTYVRIYPPRRILAGENNLEEWRQRIDKYWFWNEGIDVLTKAQALVSVIIGDTLDGDELIVHPGNPERIYVLPRQSEKIYAARDGLAAAIEWLCTSGTLTEPFPERNFEPFDSQAGHTDDVGRTRGVILGGSGDADSLWPQNLTVNRGTFRQFERRIADYLISAGQPVKFKQAFDYDKGGRRPTALNYTVLDKNGNVLFHEIFLNP